MRHKPKIKQGRLEKALAREGIRPKVLVQSKGDNRATRRRMAALKGRKNYGVPHYATPEAEARRVATANRVLRTVTMARERVEKRKAARRPASI